MLPGVYQATKKDGTIYYRSNITYCGKHISLGSYSTEIAASLAYEDANGILLGALSLDELCSLFINASFSESKQWIPNLSFEKCITLINYRDNRLYIANPIYLRRNYFSYYLSPTEELKFDIDDLFFYTRHKILRRKGHLYVNDYGMQITLLSRYGLKNYAVCGRDYSFSNGDSTDWRYSNILIKNHYYGVTAFEKKGKIRYRVKIHINGNYTIGTYSSEIKAAIAYNKAIDFAKKFGINKNYSENYIDSLSPSEYADIYTGIKLSQKYLDYLKGLPN